MTLPPLDIAGVLWIAAIDRVPIGERIEWVKTLEARVESINASRAAAEGEPCSPPESDSRADATRLREALEAEACCPCCQGDGRGRCICDAQTCWCYHGRDPDAPCHGCGGSGLSPRSPEARAALALSGGGAANKEQGNTGDEPSSSVAQEDDQP